MKCELCHSDKTVCKSHIIPEFFYKPLYDTKNRAVILYSDSNKHKEFLQKGLRDYLLCEECEQHIANNIETPFKKQWQGIIPSSCSSPVHELKGLNYTLTKLMILTNLWRAHCSQKDAWKLVKLGPYADKIAELIKKLDPGDEKDFPIFGQLLVDEKNRIRFDLITPFSKWRPESHYIYASAHGGIEWFIVISSVYGKIPRNICLNKSGNMKLLKKFFLECSSIKSFRGKK